MTSARFCEAYHLFLVSVIAVAWSQLFIPRPVYSDPQWTPLGLEQGHVSTLIVDPTMPTTLYAGTLDGGVYKSTDGGATWIQASKSLTYAGLAAFHPQEQFLDVGILGREGVAIALDPRTPTTLYAGAIDGVFKSTDGATTWTKTKLFSGLVNCCDRLAAFTIDPSTTPATIYAGAQKIGIFISRDGGTTWNSIIRGIPNFVFYPDSDDPFFHAFPAVNLFVIDPTTPTTIYAGLQGMGIYKSLDRGSLWTPINTGLLDSISLSALEIDPQNPTILYAGFSDAFGVYKSTDGGTTWEAVSAGLPDSYVAALALDPTNPVVVYAATGGGVFKTTNGGANWTSESAGLPSTPLSLAINPVTPTTLYAGTYGDGGVFVTTNGGGSWTAAAKHGLTNSYVQAVTIDPSDPKTLYVSADGEMLKSTDGGATFDGLNTGLVDPPSYLAVDPQHPEIIYALFPCCNLAPVKSNVPFSGVFKSSDGGKSWAVMNAGLPEVGEDENGIPQGIDVRKLVIAPSNPTTLYLLTDQAGVFKSIDGGISWTALRTTGLPVSGPCSGTFCPVTQIHDLTTDPMNSSLLYAAVVFTAFNLENGVYKSSDGGITWTPSFVGFDAGAGVSDPLIAIAPSDSATLYFIQGSNLYQTTNGGMSWTRLSSFFDSSPLADVSQLLIDPLNPTVLYVLNAATADFPEREFTPTEILKSTDSGRTFSRLEDGLPATASLSYTTSLFIQLAIDPKNPSVLYLGTAGNGLFVLRQ